MVKFLLATAMVFGFSVAQAKKADFKGRKPASITNNVMVGGSAEYDACGGSGVVLATTTLMYFDKAGMIKFDKVDVNSIVSSCDEDDAGHVGIVFGKKGQECGVGTPIKTKQEYNGPCKSGWIKKDFFELLAG